MNHKENKYVDLLHLLHADFLFFQQVQPSSSNDVNVFLMISFSS